MRSFSPRFLFLLFFVACTSGPEQDALPPASENDVDAARNFIRNLLDGKLRQARTFLIADSTNLEQMDVYQNYYETRMNREDKRGYRESSINIHDVRPVSDSVTIVQYSNSYKQQRDSLRVVRQDGLWLVDLKFSFLQKDPLP